MTPPIPSQLNPEEEADRLLEWHGGEKAIATCMEKVAAQFNVIQSRTQMLLSLAALTLTITGFSGPRIAVTNALARYSIAVGIGFVLISMVVVMLNTLRVGWLTQLDAGTSRDTLIAALRYRNRKTRFFAIELMLLVIGLTFYVLSVITSLWQPPSLSVTTPSLFFVGVHMRVSD